MSNYNGPSHSALVRFTRGWCDVEAGAIYEATSYPELRTYYIGAPIYAHIGAHPSHRGLLEELPKARAEQDGR